MHIYLGPKISIVSDGEIRSVDMISLFAACLFHGFLTTEAFRQVIACNVGNRTGSCLPEGDCYFVKQQGICDDDYDVCCLHSGISERKCLKYSPAGCKKNIWNKIIGGQRAASGEFPYMVAIGKDPETATEFKWFCGGSIVSETFVLTAAHCLKKRYTKSYKLLAGAEKWDDPNGQLRHVVELIIHPKFTSWQSDYDLALMKTEKPFELSSKVLPICLLPENIRSHVVRGIASGYGLEKEGAKTTPGNLMKVEIHLFKPEECTSYYPAMVKYSGSKPSLMCAGYDEGGKDSCQGDSGGPFAIPLINPTCQYGLAGVTSSGASCGLPHSPGIYIKVSYFISWIESNIWNEDVKNEINTFNNNEKTNNETNSE